MFNFSWQEWFTFIRRAAHFKPAGRYTMAVVCTLDISMTPKLFNQQIWGNQFTDLQLDQIISGVHEQAVAYSVMNVYLDYKNTPGTDAIDAANISKLNSKFRITGLLIIIKWVETVDFSVVKSRPFK